MKKFDYHGFPVVCGAELVGYITREKLMMTIEGLFSRDPMPSPERQCLFSERRLGQSVDGFEILSGLLEKATLQLRKELPQELVVSMFQKLVSCSQEAGYDHINLTSALQNLRYILFTHEGNLTGMVNKTDIVGLLHRDFQHTAALY